MTDRPDHTPAAQSVPCPHCSGRGRVAAGMQCPYCLGAGRFSTADRLEINVGPHAGFWLRDTRERRAAAELAAALRAAVCALGRWDDNGLQQAEALRLAAAALAKAEGREG